jgi:hypothetical protein
VPLASSNLSHHTNIHHIDKMSLILAQWQGTINGSRYTIHEADSWSERDIFWAIDLLADPADAKWLRISRSKLNLLNSQQLEDLEEDGFVDSVDLDPKLKDIWEQRTGQKAKRPITSKYIKIKHPRWGLIDQHRAVMQDHLDQKLPRNMVVHHKNGNTHDNRLENLEVMSLSDHTRMHCKEGGWHKRMYLNGLPKNARFTYVEAEAIRDMFKRSGESMRKFARSLDLSPRIIEDLIKKHSYA